MPEIAAIYVIGVAACYSLTALFYFLLHRAHTKPARRTLDSNLRKAGLFWSENQDHVVTWTEEVERRERRQSKRNILLTGFLLGAMSWAGFFFLLVVMLSYLVIARSRKEKRLFASALAADPELLRDEVERLSAEYRLL